MGRVEKPRLLSSIAHHHTYTSYLLTSYLLASDFMCNMAAYECRVKSDPSSSSTGRFQNRELVIIIRHQIHRTQPTAEVIQRSASFTRLTTLGEASADSSCRERWIYWNVQPVPVNVKLEGRSEPRCQGYHASDQATRARDLGQELELELMERVYVCMYCTGVSINLSLVTTVVNSKLATQTLVTLNFRRCCASIECTPEIQKSGGSHAVPVRAKRKRATKFVTSDGWPDKANQYTGSAILLITALQSARQGHCAPVEAPVSPRGNNTWYPVGAVRQLGVGVGVGVGIDS